MHPSTHTPSPRRAWPRALCGLLAIAAAGCAGAPAPDAVGVLRQGEPLPGAALVSDKGATLVSDKGATLVSDKGATLVSNNAGSFSGVVRGPSADAIARSGGLIANSGAGLVANAGAGLIANGAASFRVAALAGFAPVAAARVTFTDAEGRAIAGAAAQTDAEGRFTLSQLPPTTEVVFLVATYEAGGRTVTLSTPAEAPRLAGEVTTTVDPVSTLVGAQVARWARAGALTDRAAHAEAWTALGERLGATIDESEAVAASLGGAEGVFDRHYGTDPALREAVERLALPDAPASPSPADVSVVAGTGAPGATDGDAATASFQFPYAVAADPAGALAVADYRNHRIRRVDAHGAVTTVAGSEAGFADGPAATARFSGPRGVAYTPDGAIIVADTGNARIRRIGPDGSVSTLAGTGVPGFADGAGDTARFSEPRGVAVDASGVVYVADTGNARIRAIAPGGAVTTVAELAVGEDFVRPPESKLAGPYGVAVDAAGAVYVADATRNAVLKLGATGFTVIAGGAWGDADGAGASAGFRSPVAIAAAPDGALYVADCFNHTIRRIGPDGVVSTLAGTGKSGSANGALREAEFYGPYGLTMAGPHRLVVADTSNHTLRAIALP